MQSESKTNPTVLKSENKESDFDKFFNGRNRQGYNCIYVYFGSHKCATYAYVGNSATSSLTLLSFVVVVVIRILFFFRPRLDISIFLRFKL